MNEDSRAPEYRLTLKYDGPSLGDGRMDARDAGLAIESAGRLISRASEIAFGGEGQVSLTVDAHFRDGSFDVDYSVVSWVGEALSHLTVADLKALAGWVFGTGGLAWLVKKLEGLSPDTIEVTDNNVSFQVGSNCYEVHHHVHKFYLDEETMNAARGVLCPLKKPGVDRLIVALGHHYI